MMKKRGGGIDIDQREFSVGKNIIQFPQNFPKIFFPYIRLFLNKGFDLYRNKKPPL